MHRVLGVVVGLVFITSVIISARSLLMRILRALPSSRSVVIGIGLVIGRIAGFSVFRCLVWM